MIHTFVNSDQEGHCRVDDCGPFKETLTEVFFIRIILALRNYKTALCISSHTLSAQKGHTEI